MFTDGKSMYIQVLHSIQAMEAIISGGNIWAGYTCKSQLFKATISGGTVGSFSSVSDPFNRSDGADFPLNSVYNVNGQWIALGFWGLKNSGDQSGASSTYDPNYKLMAYYPMVLILNLSSGTSGVGSSTAGIFNDNSVVFNGGATSAPIYNSTINCPMSARGEDGRGVMAEIAFGNNAFRCAVGNISLTSSFNSTISDITADTGYSIATGASIQPAPVSIGSNLVAIGIGSGFTPSVSNLVYTRGKVGYTDLVVWKNSSLAWTTFLNYMQTFNQSLAFFAASIKTGSGSTYIYKTKGKKRNSLLYNYFSYNSKIYIFYADSYTTATTLPSNMKLAACTVSFPD